jgi:hypothetical protein
VLLRGALLEGTFSPIWVEHARWLPRKGGVKRGVVGDDKKPADGGGVSFKGSGVWGPSAVARPHAGGVVLVGAPMVEEEGAAAPPAAEAPPAGGGEEAAPPAAATRLAGPKKPRRMIGLAVGITGGGGPVVVESLGGGASL